MPLPTGYLSTIIKLGLAAALLVLLVRLVDFDLIVATAARADPRLIGVAAALLPLNLLLEGLLWHRLVRHVEPEMGFLRALKSLLAGHCLAIFTPARAGDFVGRPLYLGGSNRWELGAMVVVHRVMDMAIVITGGVGALIVFAGVLPTRYGGVWRGLAAAGVVLGIMFLGAILSPKRVHRWLTKTFRSDRARSRFRFLNLLTTRRSLELLSLAMLRYFVFTAQFLLLLLAFAPDAPVRLSYAAVGLVMFAKFIIPPVTFSDIGVREGASVFFFGLIGVNEAAGFNASIFIYLINLLMPAAAGTFFATRLKMRTRPAPLPGAESRPAKTLTSDPRAEIRSNAEL